MASLAKLLCFTLLGAIATYVEGQDISPVGTTLDPEVAAKIANSLPSMNNLYVALIATGSFLVLAVTVILINHFRFERMKKLTTLVVVLAVALLAEVGHGLFWSSRRRRRLGKRIGVLENSKEDVKKVEEEATWKLAMGELESLAERLKEEAEVEPQDDPGSFQKKEEPELQFYYKNAGIGENGEGLEMEEENDRGVDMEEVNGRGIEKEEENGRGIEKEEENGRGMEMENGREMKMEEENGRGMESEEENVEGLVMEELQELEEELEVLKEDLEEGQ
uniref:Uncharacterized protein n=1 Tax=Branchiostoma floridae TaxID=7739 RepID=C3ZI34_BRAFL|eukprot:XP_002591765.1 hypothetical protein BRAFLDRAFT_83539 [Branchiostoma floridae]